MKSEEIGRIMMYNWQMLSYAEEKEYISKKKNYITRF